MGLPESVGGLETDYLTLGLMTEELYHKTGCMTPFMTAMLAMKDIADFGTEEQAQMIVDVYNKEGAAPLLWASPSRCRFRQQRHDHHR